MAVHVRGMLSCVCIAGPEAKNPPRNSPPHLCRIRGGGGLKRVFPSTAQGSKAGAHQHLILCPVSTC